METQANKAVAATQPVRTNGAETLEAKIARLEQENARLTAAATNRSTIVAKIGAKGGISLYGFGRWPITMYLSQAVRMIAYVKSGQLEQFIEDHRSQLATKE